MYSRNGITKNHLFGISLKKLSLDQIVADETRHYLQDRAKLFLEEACRMTYQEFGREESVKIIRGMATHLEDYG